MRVANVILRGRSLFLLLVIVNWVATLKAKLGLAQVLRQRLADGRVGADSSEAAVTSEMVELFEAVRCSFCLCLCLCL
jgi:hypothetical protein